MHGTYNAVVVWRVPQILLCACLHLNTKALSFWIHDGSYLAMLHAAGSTFRAQIRRAVRVADAVVYPSREMRVAQFGALFPSSDFHDGGRDVLSKAMVVPHGVPRYFDDVDDVERRDGWLLWPVSPERGLAELLRMLPALRRAVKSRGGDFRVVVCHLRGGYHENTKLELPDDVVFAGMLPPKRLAAMLRLRALRASVGRARGLCLATWECALHGVVPVVYGLGRSRALGRVGCPCVAPGDAAALEAAGRRTAGGAGRGGARGGGTSSPARGSRGLGRDRPLLGGGGPAAPS